MNTSPAFARTIGIDYSGAETPTASLKGLRVYLAEGDALIAAMDLFIVPTIRFDLLYAFTIVRLDELHVR